MNHPPKVIACIQNAVLRTFDKAARFAILRPSDVDGAYGTNSTPVVVYNALNGRISPLSQDEVPDSIRVESKRLFLVSLPIGSDVRTRDQVRFDSYVLEVLGIREPSTGVPVSVVAICGMEL